MCGPQCGLDSLLSGAGPTEKGGAAAWELSAPETWGGIIAPTSGFQDLLPSVGALIELLLRERLRGNPGTDEEMASASWSGGMDSARARIV